MKPEPPRARTSQPFWLEQEPEEASGSGFNSFVLNKLKNTELELHGYRVRKLDGGGSTKLAASVSKLSLYCTFESDIFSHLTAGNSPLGGGPKSQ